MPDIEWSTDNYTFISLGTFNKLPKTIGELKLLPKPDSVECYDGCIGNTRCRIRYKKPISEIHKSYGNPSECLVIAMIKSRSNTNIIDIKILYIIDIMEFGIYNRHCVIILEPTVREIDKDFLITLTEAFYKVHYNPHAHLFRSYNDCFKEEEQTFPDFKQKMQRVIKEGSMFMNDVIIVPTIKKVIINDPAVIIFWSDGTKTTGKCMENDTFNPEVGFAMAISKKYFEIVGCENPRAEFKNQLKNATDQSKKTAEKKALKEKLKAKAEKHD